MDDFEDWLAAESWNMHLHADPFAQSLASAVELRLDYQEAVRSIGM